MGFILIHWVGLFCHNLILWMVVFFNNSVLWVVVLPENAISVLLVLKTTKNAFFILVDVDLQNVAGFERDM